MVNCICTREHRNGNSNTTLDYLIKGEEMSWHRIIGLTLGVWLCLLGVVIIATPKSVSPWILMLVMAVVSATTATVFITLASTRSSTKNQ